MTKLQIFGMCFIYFIDIFIIQKINTKHKKIFNNFECKY